MDVARGMMYLHRPAARPLAPAARLPAPAVPRTPRRAGALEPRFALGSAQLPHHPSRPESRQPADELGGRVQGGGLWPGADPPAQNPARPPPQPARLSLHSLGCALSSRGATHPPFAPAPPRLTPHNPAPGAPLPAALRRWQGPAERRPADDRGDRHLPLDGAGGAAALASASRALPASLPASRSGPAPPPPRPSLRPPPPLWRAGCRRAAPAGGVAPALLAQARSGRAPDPPLPPLRPPPPTPPTP